MKTNRDAGPDRFGIRSWHRGDGRGAPIPIPMAFDGFGGWKRSLFGEMAVHGMEGVRFYIPLRTLTARWPTGIRAGAEYVMPTMR